MRKPRWLIVNTAWTVLCVVAWRAGLLDAVISAPPLEIGIIGFVGLLFVFCQWTAWSGRLDAAYRAAHLAPYVALCCLIGFASTYALHTEWADAASRSAFAKALICGLPVTGSGILTLLWVETLLWSMGYQVEERA